MNELLKIFMSLSLSGTLLIVALFLCKPLFKNKLSRQWQYYIWLIVIARFLLPFAPKTNIVGNIFQKADNVIIQIATDSQSEQNNYIIPQTNYDEYNIFANSDSNIEYNNQLKPKALSIKDIFYVIIQNIGIIWLMAAIALLIKKITIYQSFVKYIKAGQIEVLDIEFWEQLGKLVEQTNIKTPCKLYINSLISSPILIGFFKPCIILPSIKMSDSDFQYTILHELTHYKRKDMFYKWLVQFTICLHWFNPFIYLMNREINRICELSCDEAIIKKLNINEQRAYGDTLLNAMEINGKYKASISSMTLNEGKELLKERLEAIMKFKKKTPLNSVISIILTFILCFGAMSTGAYAINVPINQKENNINQSEQQTTSIPSNTSTADNSLTLVKKEYSIADIKSLNISGVVVDVLSENISITRGGEKLKLEYYISDPKDYTLQKESDGGGTRENLCLVRKYPINSDETTRTISITIPYEINLTTIMAVTNNGNINLENCFGKIIIAETQSGNVIVNGGSSENFFKVKTITGNALITGTVLYSKEYSIYFETQTGTIAFQPNDTAQKYNFIVNTGEAAQIVVNDQKYKSGDFSINDSAENKIYFDSPNGALIVQDISSGKLSLDTLTPQKSSSVIQSKKEDNSNLTLVQKEYTTSDLLALNITGIRVNAVSENIVLSQGGTSLIIKYYQSNDEEYTINTNEYQIYEDGFGPEAESGMPGTIEQLVFSRIGEVIPTENRTIYITLPDDLKLNRVVKIITESGNITAEDCKSRTMLNAVTESGSIDLEQCSSLLLAMETQNGQITASDCKTDELILEAVNGNVLLKLPNRIENYELSIDAGVRTQININGKTYKSGKYSMHKDTSGKIYFESQNGTLEIKDALYR